MTTTIDTTRRDSGVADTHDGIATTGGCAEGNGESDVADFMKAVRTIHLEKRTAAKMARESLKKLIEACAQKTGQSYNLRALLYSLWNGKATPVINLLDLDYPLRRAFLEVCLGFGFDGDAQESSFFYSEVKAAFYERGLFNWFVEEGFNL